MKKLYILLRGKLVNLYDRIFITQFLFIDLHYKEFHWFTFNFADIFISGILFLIIREHFLIMMLRKLAFIIILLQL